VKKTGIDFARFKATKVYFVAGFFSNFREEILNAPTTAYAMRRKPKKQRCVCEVGSSIGYNWLGNRPG